MRLPSFSAKIEMNCPGSKSNTGSFSKVNRMRYVCGNFGAMSKTSFTITVCLPDRNFTGAPGRRVLAPPPPSPEPSRESYQVGHPANRFKHFWRNVKLRESPLRAASAGRSSRLLEEHVGVQQARDDCADERPDPVHVPVVEELRDDGRPEPPSGIHGGARQGSTHHDVERDGQPNRQAAHRVERAFRIDSRAVHHESEEE